MTALAFEQVGVDLGGRVVLEGVDLAIEEQCRVLVTGPSGCGKTTLVRAALGLVPCQRGSVRLFGRDTTGLSARGWREARKGAQLLFQDPLATLHPELSVSLSLLESAHLHPGTGTPHDRVAHALASVSLPSGLGARLPRSLSGGERRRASLARILLASPRLLLADEPTAGLDQALQADVAALVMRAAPTVVVVTHDAPPFLPYVDLVVVLDAGRVAERVRRGASPTTPVGRALLEAR